VQHTLTADRDATTDGNWAGPAANPAELKVYGDNRGDWFGGYTSQAVIGFTIPAAPTGKALQSATLRLYECDELGSPYNVYLTVCAEAWSESTWPAGFDSGAYGAGVATIAPTGVGTWHQVDVTSAVRAGVPNGFLLIQPWNEPRGLGFAGRSSANPPQLVLTYV